MMTEQDNFKRYDSPKQYAEASQQMIDARERWREQVREQEARSAVVCAARKITKRWPRASSFYVFMI